MNRRLRLALRAPKPKTSAYYRRKVRQMFSRTVNDMGNERMLEKHVAQLNAIAREIDLEQPFSLYRIAERAQRIRAKTEQAK